MAEFSTRSTERDVTRAFEAFLKAMLAADIEALDALLDDGFTLTHITGYRQPKAEWLAQMRKGSFVYHDIAERSISVSPDGERAQVVGRTVTDATVYGSRNAWRLQLALDYIWRQGAWKVLRAVATIW